MTIYKVTDPSTNRSLSFSRADDALLHSYRLELRSVPESLLVSTFCELSKGLEEQAKPFTENKTDTIRIGRIIIKKIE